MMLEHCTEGVKGDFEGMERKLPSCAPLFSKAVSGLKADGHRSAMRAAVSGGRRRSAFRSARVKMKDAHPIRLIAPPQSLPVDRAWP